MHGTALNPALIRTLVILLLLVITQILAAVKRSKTAKPSARTGVGPATQWGDALREAMRQRAEQARTRLSKLPVSEQPSQVSQEFQQPPFQQPPTIEPESSLVPSLLLLALLATLCLLAYRYWAG